MTQTVHFAPSFFHRLPELSFHLGQKAPAGSPFNHYSSLGIQNDQLGEFSNEQGLPKGVETDLRKIRQFVFDHLEELQTVPLEKNDTPVTRIIGWIRPVQFLIIKHNSRIEESLAIRILSIFLLIITFGIYNYENSLRIDPILKNPIKTSFLTKKVDDFLKSKNVPEQERISTEQQLLDTLNNRDMARAKETCDRHPGLDQVVAAVREEGKQSLPNWIQEINSLAERDKFIVFYRSGPTTCFSPFTENENGIRIYGKKFSCIISAFEYKRCEAAGCTQQELEKFPSLSGDKALAYAKTLLEKKAMPDSWSNSRLPIMEEIVQAKYSQDKELLVALNATADADLIYHTPKETNDGFWSDWGDGQGRNEFGAILERTRAFATGIPQPKQSPVQHKLLHHAGSATNLLYKIGDD